MKQYNFIKLLFERKEYNLKPIKTIKENKMSLMEGVSTRDVQEYLQTALWSSTDDNGNAMDEVYDLRDIDKSVWKDAKKDLTKFYAKAKKLLEDGDYDRDWRHDFWLSRNGHGSGFFDDGGEDGDILQKMAEKFGEVSLYAGDDGKIYQM